MSLILLLSPIHHFNYKALFNSYCTLMCVRLNSLVSLKLKIIIDKEKQGKCCRGCFSCKDDDVSLNLFFLLT